MKHFVFILCITLTYCTCYKWNKDVLSCNTTSECELYVNTCQITTCQNGFCLFTVDFNEEGCCTNATDCIVKEYEEASCVDNICEYKEIDCSSKADIIGIFIGVLLLLGLSFGFFSIIVLLIIKTISDKKHNTIITSIPKREQNNIQKYNPNKSIIVGKCALCSF